MALLSFHSSYDQDSSYYQDVTESTYCIVANGYCAATPIWYDDFWIAQRNAENRRCLEELLLLLFPRRPICLAPIRQKARPINLSLAARALIHFGIWSGFV